MNYLTLASNVRNYFGIYASHLQFQQKEIFILLQHINEKSVIFACPKINIRINNQSKISFNSVYGNIEMTIKISSISNEQYMFIIEATITGINKEDFLIALNNFLFDVINKHKRREERIICTKENLRKLNLINTFLLSFKGKKYKCFIQDISASSLRCITSIDLLQHINERFSIIIRFSDPDAAFTFKDCFVVRKNELVINDIPLAEIVLCLNNINKQVNFNFRLDYYFEKNLKKIR